MSRKCLCRMAGQLPSSSPSPRPTASSARASSKAVRLCLLVLAFIPKTAESQSTFCFPGRPAPECKVVALLETTVLQRFAGDAPVLTRNARREAIWEVGALVNRSERDAWGGTFVLGTGEYRPRVGLKLRYRRWLADDDWTMDLGAGPLTHATSIGGWGVGLQLEGGVGYRDYVGTSVRLELLPTADGPPVAAGMMGLKLGSWPAVVGNGALGLVFVLWLLTADFQ